jgi:lactoylglutathione lyase
MALHFRYAAFFVRDVPATVAFYDKAFGFKQRYMHPSSGYAELETGATLLCFISDDFLQNSNLIGGLPYSPNRPEANPVAAQVAFVCDDIETDWARAVAAGAVVVKTPEAKPWGQTAGYLRDCNGVIVELNTRSPRDAV